MSQALATPVRTEPTWLTTADNIVGVFVNIGGWIGGATVIVLMLHIVADVFMRYVFNSPLPGTIEIVSYWWMILITFLGQGLTQRRREHLEVSLLTDLMPQMDRLGTIIGGRLLTLITVVALGYYGLLAAIEQTHRGEIAMGSITIAIWPMRWMVPIGMGIFAAQLVVDLIRDVRLYAEAKAGRARN